MRGTDLNINLGRQVLRIGKITCFHVLLLSLVYTSANAQQSKGSPNNPYGQYTNFDPTTGAVIFVLICALFFIGVFFIFVRQCMDATTTVVPNLISVVGDRSRLSGLDPAAIEKFPVFLYSEVKDVKIGRETLECAICLSEFEDDETLRLLPKCNHVFHPACIDEWLSKHVTCPVCRAMLTPESEEIMKDTPPETTTESSPRVVGPNHVEIVISEDRRPTMGKFPRSHSTGHCNVERYTLRLPEEVRKEMMASARLKRAMSFSVVLAKEGSSRKGYRGAGGGEGSSRGKQIGRFLMNSSFISRGSSIKSCGDGDSVNGRNLLASVTKPLNCLNMKVDGGEEPSTRPRPLV